MGQPLCCPRAPSQRRRNAPLQGLGGSISAARALQLLVIKAATSASYAVAKILATNSAYPTASTVGDVVAGGARVSVVYDEGASLLHGRRNEGREHAAKVAVVVPVLLRPKDVPQLARLAAALANQEELPRLVLFVDDGSPLPFKDLRLPDVFHPLVAAGVHVKARAPTSFALSHGLSRVSLRPGSAKRLRPLFSLLTRGCMNPRYPCVVVPGASAHSLWPFGFAPRRCLP